MSSKIRPLSKPLQERATKDLNEHPSRVEEDIEYIKKWVEKQPHLTAIMDDQWILQYLRGCKFSLERTKEKMDLFYTMRSMIPEVYTNRDPLQAEIQEILKLGLYLSLPNLTPDGKRVVIIRICHFDPDRITIPNMFKVLGMFQDIQLYEDDDALISGTIIIEDMKNIAMKHITHAQPSFVKKIITLTQSGYPARPKGIYFVNNPSIFETAWTIVNPFISEKMKARIKILRSDKPEELFKYVPKSILPKEYGGEAGTCDQLAISAKTKVERYRDWLIDTSKTGSNEKKRPGRPKSSEELFGVGSFRKLNVD